MKITIHKKPLTPEQLEECAKLKAIFNAKKGELKLTQESLGHEIGMKQGSVGQYFNGVNKLNLQAAMKFANALKVDIGDFSPRLKKEAIDLGLTPGTSDDRSVSERGLRHIYGAPKTNLIQVKSLAQIINREQGSAEVSAPAELPPNTVAYVLENDSMEGPGRKYIPRGSTLYIVEGAQPEQGKVVLASLAGSEVIGEYSLFAGKPHLRPYNTQYLAVDVTDAQIGGTLEGVYWKP